MKSLLRPAYILGAVLVVYVGSYFVFHRMHLEWGVYSGGKTTSVGWRVEDTAFNRFLVGVYTPMARLMMGYAMPVEWESL